MQYHELRVTFEFDTSIPGVDSATSDALEATLWCDYVYLDQEERKKFASQPHEYLIEQIQFTGDENVTVAATSKAQQIRLSFNHPTKLLAWVVADPTKHGKFTAGAAGAIQEANAPLQNAKLMLNGHDRADVRVGAVYNKVVPYQANKANPDAGIYYMSFALSPTQHAPSGSLNLSRIDSAVLALTFKAASAVANTTVPANIANVTAPETTTTTDAQNLSALRVFAVNYNVLRKNYAKNSRMLDRFEDLPDERNIVRSSGPDTLYNLLVNFITEIGNTPGCGNLLRAISTMPFEKSKVSKQGNDLADRNNDMDWTIRSRDPKHAMIVYGSCSETAQGVHPRKSSASDEGVRYSPNHARKTWRIRLCPEWGVWLTPIEWAGFTCHPHIPKQTKKLSKRLNKVSLKVSSLCGLCGIAACILFAFHASSSSSRFFALYFTEILAGVLQR